LLARPDRALGHRLQALVDEWVAGLQRLIDDGSTGAAPSVDILCLMDRTGAGIHDHRLDTGQAQLAHPGGGVLAGHALRLETVEHRLNRLGTGINNRLDVAIDPPPHAVLEPATGEEAGAQAHRTFEPWRGAGRARSLPGALGGDRRHGSVSHPPGNGLDDVWRRRLG